MKNILKAEFFKLKKSKAMLICAIIFGAYILFISGVFLLISVLAGEGGLTADFSLYLFSSMFPAFSILTTIVICGFYSGEYGQGVIRNSLCSGVSRSRVYLAKFIMSMIITAFVYIVATLAFMALLGLLGGWGAAKAGVFTGFWFLGLLLYLSTGALTFMFSILTKNTGATIGISIGIAVFANLFTTISTLVIAFSVVGGGNDGITLGKVLNEIALVLPSSQLAYVGQMALKGWRVVEAAGVGAAALAGAYFCGLAVFKNEDQK